ncbi:hypothetical protein ACIBMX_48715 [Streptomyces phaeochromogenes]|uniref:hypothetical protein n=1 Tax=Streptomyces phaeochromogenes TaxID=1923 RepID=UPI0033D54AE1
MSGVAGVPLETDRHTKGAAMSYGYGGGPNWPMIRAKQRAESAADSARHASAAWKASAAEWKAKFEALAEHVREAADEASLKHQQEGTCRCRSCWDAVITGLAQEANASGTSSGNPGAAGYTFSLGDLFGGSAPPGRG